MINQQLLEYVRAQKSTGLSREAITQALASGGWTADDVREAFMAIDGVSTPPAPTPPPPQQVAPRVVVPPPGSQPTGVVAPPPTQAQSTPAVAPRVVQAPGVSFVQPAKRKGRVFVWILVVLIILFTGVGALGIVAYLNPPLVTSVIPALGIFFPTPETRPIESTVPTPEQSAAENLLDASTTIPLDTQPQP